MNASRARRLNRILTRLRTRNGAGMRELAAELGVSHMTVRRDLAVLQEQGLVTLFHGGAAYNTSPSTASTESAYSLVTAESRHAAEKRRIGRSAARLVEPGDTLIIDTGSTTETVARELPDDYDLTVLCYSLNVLHEVTRKRAVNLIFAGGTFHPNTLMFESPEGIALIRRTRATKAFISAAGVSLRLGVTCVNSYERDTKVAVIGSSLQRILVADSSKLDTVQPAYFADIGEFDIFVTDAGLSSETGRQLEDQGISLIVAE
ncbi:MAG: DeoR/GlpR family DNA-binding transcription regulator [Spirochaetota bacterium]